MPRPKKYDSPAARQAAFRERTRAEFVQVPKQDMQKLNAKLNALHTAITAARQAGDALAFEVCTASPDTTLERLIDEFKQRALHPARGALLPPALKQKKDRAKSSKSIVD
jgi:hypothetical protein